MNVAAASLFSSGMSAGMPTPAPPVGHTGDCAAGPPGRNPTPTSNGEFVSTPTSEPVDSTVAAATPAEKSAAASVAATPAHFPPYTESLRNSTAAIDSAESQVMSKLSGADQPPP